MTMRHSPSHGYTLLEIALVLAVLGVLLGGALSVYTQANDAQKFDETRERLIQIDQALKRFFAINRYLPCAANGAVPDNSAALGLEMATNSGTATAPRMTCVAPQGGAEMLGIVPVRTLGLPPEYAYDAWGRRISYQLTSNLRHTDNWLNQSVDGDIDVHKLDGSVLTDTTGGAAYVLISHGRNGYYAYLADGSRLSIPGGYTGADIDNGSGLDGRFTYSEKTASFDDVVLFRAKGDIYVTKRFARVVEPRTVTCTNARSIVRVPRDTWVGYFAAAYQTHANRIYNIALKMDQYCSNSTLVAPVHCPRNTLYLGPCLASEISGGTCTTMSYSDGEQYNYAMSNGTIYAGMDRRTSIDCQCPGFVDSSINAYPKFLNTSFSNHYFGACLP